MRPIKYLGRSRERMRASAALETDGKTIAAEHVAIARQGRTIGLVIEKVLEHNAGFCAGNGPAPGILLALISGDRNATTSFQNYEGF